MKINELMNYPSNYPVQATLLSPTFRQPNLFLCRFPDCQPVVSELPLAQLSSAVSVVCPSWSSQLFLITVFTALLKLLLLPLFDFTVGAQLRA